ncbi:putative rhamnogalacturonate lyase C [Glarea lozoyensis 74030]|uniref:Putative rhamnogalacturonate lyase C n=1 Tax=Glarea lozoyensis (strain ATCC 74030 / MF5533) TaxID=1104152 RepID=H0EF32_GLAL7|nr:putative rhamnogalacturonate lyase C [Glarea lozoyensis 74030]
MFENDFQISRFGNAERYDGEFVQPTPKCDVLLHCGDLTMTGGIADYKKCIQMLGTIDAEVKLVIAGNHDRDLDPNWDQHPDEFDQEVQDEHEEAIALWKGPIAKAAGVTYLEEGLNTLS